MRPAVLRLSLDFVQTLWTTHTSEVYETAFGTLIKRGSRSRVPLYQLHFSHQQNDRKMNINSRRTFCENIQHPRLKVMVTNLPETTISLTLRRVVIRDSFVFLFIFHICLLSPFASTGQQTMRNVVKFAAFPLPFLFLPSSYHIGHRRDHIRSRRCCYVCGVRHVLPTTKNEEDDVSRHFQTPGYDSSSGRGVQAAVDRTRNAI